MPVAAQKRGQPIQKREWLAEDEEGVHVAYISLRGGTASSVGAGISSSSLACLIGPPPPTLIQVSVDVSV